MTQANAVVLLSGGLDSSTVLAMAQQQNFNCYALSFHYGQRSHAELTAAKRVADALQVAEHRVMRIDLGQFGGSALTDTDIAVPDAHDADPNDIPVTYVPARNTVFLSMALAWAEVIEARDIFIGVNAVDYSGYPDCRPEYIAAFETMANLATKAGVEGHPLKIHTPLIDLTKGDIIAAGTALAVPYQLTVSCYQATDDGEACGRCDSCEIRRAGFKAAGTADLTRYAKT
ncbi:MAG TPA: 7-cyano-7-deazaguanine synthase QueC [Gammaproteobacteria bacterium]|nr:7-cyano-7-deazaguanine synthase QueC [Gammaproteobacteria bacterium]HBK13957.1 7-cyano-7-deazaguanine synthase QueC [Gammaproteobacteria bacterium]|tara:strand:+ start:253 stop:942 length:690 start_codon:yes stop_codon:yes gene_type:complete